MGPSFNGLDGLRFAVGHGCYGRFSDRFGKIGESVGIAYRVRENDGRSIREGGEVG